MVADDVNSNPYLIDREEEASRLQRSHPNRVTQVYSVGRGYCSESVKHDVQLICEADHVKLISLWLK